MKFCDIPYHQLYDYFSYFASQDTSPVSASSLRGPKTGISISRSEWIYFYIEYYNEEEDYKKYFNIRLKPLSGGNIVDPNDSNIFKFTKHPDDEEPLENSKAYVRKDGILYDWLKFYKSYSKRFENIYAPYTYIGSISKFTNEIYGISYYGMKDYVMDALPEHDRTVNLEEFMYLYFDKVHNEGYNKAKNVKTLLDASEIDPEYMSYIAGEFNIKFNDSFLEENDEELELKKRQYLRNIVPLLKRKGTYASIKIIYDLLS